jgi:hypothetical protein
MRLHPETSISETFKAYLSYPDSVVRLVCKLTYYQFSYYLHRSNPGSVDCPDTISSYAQLLGTSSDNKQFVVRVEKLFMEATDLLKVLQCLCTSLNNRKSLVSNHEFRMAVSNFLLQGGEKETESTLDLLLTCLTEGQSMAIPGPVKGKARTSASGPSKGGNRQEARQELLTNFPEIVQQLQSVLESERGGIESIKTLCSALLWYIQAETGKYTHAGVIATYSLLKSQLRTYLRTKRVVQMAGMLLCLLDCKNRHT